MSKLSFRARALDPSKQMPIFLAEELPDLPEYSAINRAVPQMPSGMEKEEESEHHLQRAICTGLIIPTPEVYTTENTFYDQSYPADYKMPRQLIHMQPLGLEQDVPDYDMDSADEAWVNQQNRRLDLTPLKFEQMMDRLEKSSGQTVITLNEAKALLKQDDELSIAVYDYWLNKRLKMQHPLIPTVKTENRPGASSNNPYLAFRRRTEKMQTRKNRKNDETSYEKMLKLRRDLQRATTVLEMVKRREKTKLENVHLSIEIFEKRMQLRDFSGAVYSELNTSLKNSRLAFAPLYTNQYSHHSSSAGSTPTGGVTGTAAGGTSGVLPPSLLSATGANNNSTMPGSSSHLYSTTAQYLNSSSLGIDVINSNNNVGGIRKEKRQYKKRKHKLPRDKQQQQQQQQQHHQYLSTTVGGAAAASPTVAHHSHLHHHLHRQSSSPAANESNFETEEEDLVTIGNSSGGGHHAHKIGSESEDEAPFAFRRKQNCDYLKASASAGNWPWEPKEEDRENGFCDSKYRFTLTSLRHPRPRCIGFARRRLGRGGRVIFDRVATNFDDFWSQLDYTILESGDGVGSENFKSFDEIQILKKRKSLRKRIPSPPTVVDLPATAIGLPKIKTTTVMTTTTNTPANTIKTEIADQQKQTQQEKCISSKSNGILDEDEADFDEYSDLELDDDTFNELHRCANYKITQDERYASTISLKRRRLERLIEKRKKRRKQQTDGDNNSKITPLVTTTKTVNVLEKAMSLPPLPHKLLRKLASSIGLTHFELTTKDAEMNEATSLTDGVTIKKEPQEQEPAATTITTTTATVENGSSNHLNSNIIIINNNNNKNSNNNNNNNSSSINNSNSLSLNDKFNVIKLETNSATVTSSVTATATVPSSTDIEIKQEILDSASCASADDSNEPLSSIQKSAAANIATDIAVDEDEENVNLAQLSNIIRHTFKKEDPLGSDVIRNQNRQHYHVDHHPATYGDMIGHEEMSDDEAPLTLNQVADVIRLHMRNRKNQSHRQKLERNLSVIIDDGNNDGVGGISGDTEYPGSLSPSSSQRLDVCNELLSEIRRDWLHFRPKTPTDELSDGDENDFINKLPPLFGGDNLIGSEPLVNWSKQTPITVEVLCVNDEHDASKKACSLTNLFDNGKFSNVTDNLFVTDSFKYEELDADTQLLQSIYSPHINRGSSKSPENNLNSNSIDFNFSGDSLNDINLLEGDGDVNNDDENMLDNILQECQIDDMKTLNQATNFWNGILDGETTPEVDVADDDDLLGCISGSSDKKQQKDLIDKLKNKRNKNIRQRVTGSGVGGGINGTIGSCIFNIPTQQLTRDEIFFNKEFKKEEKEEIIIKKEIPDQTISVAKTSITTPIALATTTTTTIAPTMPPLVVIKKEVEPKVNVEMPKFVKLEAVATSAASRILTPTLVATTKPNLVTTSTTVKPMTSMKITPQQHQLVHPVIGNLTQIVTTPAIGGQSSQLLQQTPTQLTEIQTAAVGDIITVPTGAVTTTPTSSNQQHHILQIKQQPTNASVASTTTQLRNITVQQLSQPQHQERQQQQQQLLFQYMASATNAGQLRQPTLTPIGATTMGGNHLTYITTTEDGVVTTSGPQKIYIQKTINNANSNASSSASQVPSNVITLSSMKLENESTTNISGVNSTTPTTTRILIDNSSGNSNNNTNNSGVGGGSGNGGNVVGNANVNIINTTGVHNIAGGSNVGTTGTPLIVTTQRNAQQLTQQQLLQPTQQIVWRQIGTTTGGAVLTTTTEAMAAAAAGNKIVFTSRPNQKRQLNGPDGTTDISKLLLNRKYSQRKVIATQQTTQQQLQQQQQQQQQQQIHITKQQQQQIVQIDEDSNSAASSQSAGSSGAGSNSSTVNELNTGSVTSVNVATQQQLQKLQMQSGKVIKMSSFPLLVSELNMQTQAQQQQQQQKQHNSAATIAANHNYSLQPTAAIITSQGTGGSGGQTIVSGGNKIYLTSSGGATVVPHGTTNFTIATTATNANELQQATSQKIHYKDLQGSNLKVNLVTTSSSGGGNVQSSTGQTVVLNKSLNSTIAAAAAAAANAQQQKLKRERILNIIGATTTAATNTNISSDAASTGTSGNATVVSSATTTQDNNNKRVLYTSLLNVKKTNAGQVQMQIGPGGFQHVLRGRIGNNQAIFTNMRPMPITALQQQQQQNVTNSGGGVGSVSVGTPTQVQVIATSSNMPITVTTSYAVAAAQQQQQSTTSTAQSATTTLSRTMVNHSTTSAVTTVASNTELSGDKTTTTTMSGSVGSTNTENNVTENRVGTPTNAITTTTISSTTTSTTTAIDNGNNDGSNNNSNSSSNNNNNNNNASVTINR